MAVVTADDNRWQRCDLKTISLVGNVLMRQLAADAGAVETVMFRDGNLTEASASNVLVVMRGVIVAPPKDHLILPGITYGAAYEFAREAGLPFEMRPVSRAEVLVADEMWLSSSTKEVIAVTTMDGRPFASGTPGPMFRKVHALFQEHKPRLETRQPAARCSLQRVRRPVAAVMEHEAAPLRPWARLDPADEQHVVARDVAVVVPALERRDAAFYQRARRQPQADRRRRRSGRRAGARIAGRAPPGRARAH